MKLFCLTICLISFQQGFCQTMDKCGILKDILEDSVARQIYKFYLHKNDTITLVDKSNFLKGCSLDEIKGLPVQTVGDSTGMHKENYYLISVYARSVGHKKQRVQVYAVRTHGLCTFELEKNKGQFNISNKRYGILD